MKPWVKGAAAVVHHATFYAQQDGALVLRIRLNVRDKGPGRFVHHGTVAYEHFPYPGQVIGQLDGQFHGVQLHLQTTCVEMTRRSMSHAKSLHSPPAARRRRGSIKTEVDG